MARWIYAALAAGWVLSMIYECVQAGTGAAMYASMAIIGVTVLAIFFVADVKRGEQKPVPRMLHFLGAAVSAALFYMALENAARAGTYVRYMPFYLVMFLYFLAAGLFMWWKELKKRR